MPEGAQKSGSKAFTPTRARRAPERRVVPPAYGPATTLDALGTLHAWAGNNAVAELVGRGAPLAPEVRSQMESRFGADFSAVRIHDDTSAHAAAASLHANAYTVGSNIVFAADRFSAHTSGGKRLIAHELAHVIQQRRGGAAPQMSESAPHEAGAHAAASAFATTSAPVAVQGATGVGVARDAVRKTYDFYEHALGGNRAYYWGIGNTKTPKGWPGNDTLRELWGALGIPSTRPKGKATVDDHKLAHQPEFVEFADRVRDFQTNVMGRKSPNGVVDTETARLLADSQARNQEDEQKAATKKADEEKVAAEGVAVQKSQGTLTGVGTTVSGTANVASSPLGVLSDISAGGLDIATGGALDYAAGGALDFIVGDLKNRLVDAVLQNLGIPTAGSRIAAAIGRGMGEQIVTELIDNKKGLKLLNHLKEFKAVNVLDLYEGYLIGVGEGLVSPVTDLWGLVEFGESIDNLMQDLLVSAFNINGQFTQELNELTQEARNVYQKLGEFWQEVKSNKLKTLAAILSAPQALSDFAEKKAYELGKEAGTALVDGLEDPWRPNKEATAPDPLRSPAKYVSYLAKKGEDYVVDAPWAKVGLKVGYAIGWVAIQAILIAFTEGIGNAIEQVAQALSKAAGVLGRFSELAGAAVGKIAEFLKWIGEGATLIEKGIAKAIEKVAEKLPFLGKLLEPLSKLFEKLQKFLRRLFNVVEKDGALLIERAAAKAAPEVGEQGEKLLPKPPPPEAKPHVPPKAKTPPAGKVDAEPKVKVDPQPKVEAHPKPKVEAQPKPKVEADPKVNPKEEPKLKPKEKPKAKPKDAPEKKTGGEPKVEPKETPKKKSGGKPKSGEPAEAKGKPQESGKKKAPEKKTVPAKKKPPAKTKAASKKKTPKKAKEPAASKPASKSKTPGKSKSPKPVEGKTSKTAKPKTSTKAAPPAKKSPHFNDPHRMRPDATNFDRRTAGTGGIDEISFLRDPEGRYAVKIKGKLQEGLYRGKGKAPPGKTKAPEYNKSDKFIKNREAGLDSNWENAHLWGPGFGDEAAAGMMKAPKSVNQWYQNEGIEGWMRDLRKAAGPGATVDVEATAVAWDLRGQKWQPKAQVDFLKTAEYRVKLTTASGESASIRVTIDVAAPPSNKVVISCFPPDAANPADILKIIKGTKKP